MLKFGQCALWLCLCAASGLAAASAFTIARRGQPLVDIVLAPDAILPEQTAAQELADYLGKIVGAPFEIVKPGGRPKKPAHIFVGPTRAALRLGLTPEKLGPEEWILRPAGRDLIVTGGRPRGTLYAVYHFLEDILGVHWWNPWEESVPSAPTLEPAFSVRRGQPVFAYRDIYMLYGHDGGRFAARNRLNREGDAKIKAEYGGCRDYGPPYHVHTFNMYFPPKEYGATHPEFFSLINGKRLIEHSQLCLTNPELRQAFLAKLRQTIARAEAEARAQGAPPPDVFSVSQNDWGNPCQCHNCQAIARAEESEAGPLLDFVNFLADGIKEQFPWAYIDTLAYQYTQKAPKTIRPRDNVIIRLCDTESDPTKPITAEENKAFREHLQSWAAITKNLRIWDYAVTYAQPVGLPLPTVHTYAEDYKFYKAHNVEGVFTELEFPILADLRDFKVWMMMKLLENPYADYNKLVATFMDGFYGLAGRFIQEYVRALEEEMKARQTRASWIATPLTLTYLNLRFIHKAHRLFDEAEKAVAGNETLLRRVRHARLPLDRATIVCYTRLNTEWQALGKPAELQPPDREALGARALQSWMQQAQLRLPEAAQAAEKAAAEKELRRYAALPSLVPLPEKFRSLPPGTVFDYTAETTRNWMDIVKIVPDAEAESGFANKLDLASADTPEREKYVLPMPWGLYSVLQKQLIGTNAIKAEDIPGPGYHWYKLGTYALQPSIYVYFFWSWIIQVDVENAYDPAHPEQKFDIWARIKFTGPRFPHPRPGEQDAIYVERVVLVKAQEQ